jgi:hypothetical protein
MSAGNEEFRVQDSGFRRRVLLLLIMILIDLGWDLRRRRSGS